MAWNTKRDTAQLVCRIDTRVVAIHFAGPTWESNSGSQVVGALPPQAVVVDPNAIA